MALPTSIEPALDGLVVRRAADAADVEYRKRRMDRLKAREKVWAITQVKSPSGFRPMANCGRALVDASKPVTVMLTGTPGQPGARAGFANLQSCGSVWACPVCAEKINAVRREDLARAIESWRGQGGRVLFGTFTVRHNNGHRLEDLWEAVSPAWNRVVGGSAYVGNKKTLGDRARFGIQGWARLLEVTHGVHGWHPHLHVLFFLRDELTDEQRDDMRHRLYSRWEKALQLVGFQTVEFGADGAAVGVDLRPVTDDTYVADYFAKNGYRPKATSATGAAFEMTGSHQKKVGAGMTPMQLLAEIVAYDDGPYAVDGIDLATGEIAPEHVENRRHLALWAEWESVSRGRRQLTWSRGLRDLCHLDDEKTDEIVAAEAELAGTPISSIPAHVWKSGAWWLRLGQLADAAEAGGIDELLTRRSSGRRATGGVAPPPGHPPG